MVLPPLSAYSQYDYSQMRWVRFSVKGVSFPHFSAPSDVILMLMKIEDIRKPKYLRCAAESIHEEIITGKRFGLPGTALERLREREKACLAEAEEIERKLQSIEDPEVSEMIRLYAEGKNWNKINRILYNYPSFQACRKRAERALEKL